MPVFPQHRSAQFSDFGVHLRRINSSKISHSPIAYAHQDDYYVFGLVEKGEGCCIIDFAEKHFASGDMFLIQPGQVHRFVSSENSVEGWALIVDSSIVDSAEKCIFDSFSLIASSFQVVGQRKYELKQIVSLLDGRMDHITDQQIKTTVRRLAEVFVGIVAEAVRNINLQQTKHSRRHVEIVLSFRRLLAEHLASSRQPSYYASLLNISTVYLNEVVKGVTGMNATLFIKNEVVLQAKRLLVHTDLAVKEISNRLGIDDYAYFSRLFSRATGISPTMFKKRILE